MTFALIGTKLGMTQVYDEDNNLVPVTIIQAGPCPVLQVKTSSTDGYDSVQIGYNPKGKPPNKATRPAKGHASKAGVEHQQKLQEFTINGDSAKYELGSILTVEKFLDIETVDVVAVTKGRGFQGVVKRWNFKGGPASHGSMFHRRGGSYGLCQWPGRVFKNKKMPGHMGNKSRTTQNLKVVKIIPEKNLILLKGSVPGHKNSLLTVRVSKKLRKVS
jgi:large subunit ribosomal protein L3